jgi:aspartate aminotransferase
VIPSELAGLAAPLERFEALRRRVVALGPRLCDLSYANPYDGAQERAVEAIRQALDDDRLLGLQYSPFGGQTLVRRAAASALSRVHGLPYRHHDVVLTPGAMSALQLVMHTVAEPGGEVVIPVPCWLDHPLYVAARGLTPVLVPHREPSFDLDVGAIADAVTPRTVAVVLTQPGNPTGRHHPDEVLRALAEALAAAADRHGCRPTVIADEAHRDFVVGDLAAMARHHDRTVSVYSFGKHHFLQGQRIGYAAVSPTHPERRAVADELVGWTRITGHATPTALMQRAVPRLLELHHDHTWLVERRRAVTGILSDHGYSVVPAEATMFLYVRVPGDGDDERFTAGLVGRGVLVLPAAVFHHRGYVRLSLTATEAMLERALAVLGEVAEQAA